MEFVQLWPGRGGGVNETAGLEGALMTLLTDLSFVTPPLHADGNMTQKAVASSNERLQQQNGSDDQNLHVGLIRAPPPPTNLHQSQQAQHGAVPTRDGTEMLLHQESK